MIPLCRKVLRPCSFWKTHCPSITRTLHVGLVAGHIYGRSYRLSVHVSATVCCTVQLGTYKCVAAPVHCCALSALSAPRSCCCSCSSPGRWWHAGRRWHAGLLQQLSHQPELEVKIKNSKWLQRSSSQLFTQQIQWNLGSRTWFVQENCLRNDLFEN